MQIFGFRLMRWSRWLHVLWLGGALSGAAIDSAMAQTTLVELQGVWTIGPAEECPARSYSLSVTGNQVSFRDLSGNVDMERITGFFPDGFSTVTVASAVAPVGTSWRYLVVNGATVQVRNIVTGRLFTLRRCPPFAVGPAQSLTSARPGIAPASPTPMVLLPPPALRAVNTAASRPIGPSFDCDSAGAQREPLPRLICADPALSRLDLAFVQSFQALRQQVGDVGQSDLRVEANAFHAAVLERCGIPSPVGAGRAAQPPTAVWVPATARACVTNLYQEQRQAWMNRLVPAAREEAERSLERHIALQAILGELGFLPPGSTPDGNYGSTTRAAVAAWQRTVGVEPSGFLSDADAALLEKSLEQARSVAHAEAAAREEEERRQQAQAERAAADAKARALADAAAQDEEERREKAEVAREQAEAAARIAADVKAREEAARQQRAAAERAEAVSSLVAALGGDANSAAVIVNLGRDGSRVRRTLKGDLVLMDPAHLPSACSILGSQTPVGFADFARERYANLLGSSPQAFRTSCPFGDDVLQQDILLLQDVASSRATTPTLVVLANALASGKAEIVGHVSPDNYRADLERRRQEAADEVARLAALSDEIRRDALGGHYDDWAAVTLAGRTATSACVIAPPNSNWTRALRSALPSAAAGSLQSVSAENDADRQFARWLSGECGMLVAHGADLGDVLKGAAANKREAIVLPVRITTGQIAIALQPSVDDTKQIAMPTQVAPHENIENRSIRQNVARNESSCLDGAECYTRILEREFLNSSNADLRYAYCSGYINRAAAVLRGRLPGEFIQTLSDIGEKALERTMIVSSSTRASSVAAAVNAGTQQANQDVSAISSAADIPNSDLTAVGRRCAQIQTGH